MCQLIYLSMWHVLNLLLSFFDILCWLQWRLHSLKLWSYDRWRCRLSATDDISVLEECSRNLSKLPHNLCVIIAPSEQKTDKLVIQKLLNYAQIVGIEYISLYNPGNPGCPEKDCMSIAALEPPEGVRCELNKSGRGVVWLPVEAELPKKGLQNNLKFKAEASPNKGRLTIRQFDASDGHALIADICRELFCGRDKAEVQTLVKNRTLLTEYIDKQLLTRLEIAEYPEPELGIIFAPISCTYGMLPWHIRATEFHTIPKGRAFNANIFVEVLRRYARSEQRWGT